MWDEIPDKAPRRKLTAFFVKRARPELSEDEKELMDVFKTNNTGFQLDPEKDKPWLMHASNLLGQVKKEEPGVTKLLDRLGDKHHGHLEGLDFRLKAIPSLVRKMKSEGIPDPAAAAKAMSDPLRYTMMINPKHYTDGVKNILGSLQDQGFKLRTKNLWQRGNAYMGLNVAMHTPQGSPVELQFHTPDSIRVKDEIHPIYERFRVSTDNSVRRPLFQKMVDKSKDVEIPGGIEGLPTEVYRPYEDLPALTSH